LPFWYIEGGFLLSRVWVWLFLPPPVSTFPD